MSFLFLNAEEQYMFTSIDSKQGLSNNKVNSFLRDSKGFIWIGTTDGLNRYDGYSFKIYRNNPKDSSSLRSNTISFLAEDYDGKIWIGAGSYLEILDPQTDQILHADTLFNGKLKFEPDAKWNLHKDRFNNYWFASSFQGLYKYMVEKDSLIMILEANNPNFVDRIYQIASIAEDSNGDIWAIDNKVLKKIENKTHEITVSYSLKALTSADSYYSIFIDRDDDIWVLDRNNGIGAIFINTKEGTIELFDPNSRKCRINTSVVTGFEQDSEGKIWVLTDHGGVNLIDKTDFSVQYIRSNPLNDKTIAEDVIIGVYKDYEDIIWLGTYKNGFSYYHKNLFQFGHYEILSSLENPIKSNDIDNFVEDAKGNVWIGTNGGGLIHFNRKNNTFKFYNHDPLQKNSLSADIIVGLTIDRNENLWIGTYFGGLNKWNGQKFTHFRSNTTKSHAITDDRVWDICEDSDGLLWIATLLGGVNVLDPTTGMVEQVFRGLNDTSIRSEMVFSVIEDRKEKMWFTTYDGIRSYDKKNRKFEYFEHNPDDPYSLSDNHAFEILEDSRGLFWVATSNGLNILDEPTGKFIRLYKNDGLPANRILTILEDDDHNIWVSTSKGLSRIVVTYKSREGKYEFSFTNFSREHGLQDNEFNEKAAFKTKSGELLFGGSNGFNLFHPKDIRIENSMPNIVFTDFLVFNQSYSDYKRQKGPEILRKSISYTNSVELNYSENVFTIEFSNLNYFHPESHVYQYSLENFSNTWTETQGSERKVTYTNLDPGSYIFHVRAVNPDGTWHEAQASLTITIKPPFWKTWWFRSFMIVLLLLIVLLTYYLRFRQLHAQKNQLEDAVEKRTNELQDLNTILEERQEEISRQNEELNNQQGWLEMQVEERTTDLEGALKKAQEADRLKSSFLANMSHEIRTPMNAIVGFSHLLKEDLIDEERDEYIDVIEKNCDSLLVIINDILDISTIEANQLSIKKKPFDLVKMFKELYDNYKIKGTEVLSITFNTPDNLDAVVINQDEIRLKQVIQNLIDNAIKFTDNGEIRFGFVVKNNRVIIEVEDTGKGIRPEDQDKIFQAFTKIEDKSNRFYNGAGLGLAICKKIIDLMQGSISYKSEFGNGTSFWVSLPDEISVELLEVKLEKQEIQSIINNGEVLIAEDEPANFYLIEKILRNTKLRLTWARNGQEAIDFVSKESEKFSIILMDIKMPVVDGIKAFTEIQKINSTIPIVAITAYAFESEKTKILKHGFAEYISKPIRPAHFVKTMERVLGVKTQKSKFGKK